MTAQSRAAVCSEPVIGAGAILPLPPAYFPKVREICDRYGILLIVDEVVCGLGSTGTLFGAEQLGLHPDIVTLVKGLTSGYLPLGVSVVSDQVWLTIAERLPDRVRFSHGFTYWGHPACCAAALANIELIEHEDLVGNAERVGAHLLERLRELERFDSVGEVRALGLMAGIEPVADKETRRGFADPHTAGERVEHEARERGLYRRDMGIEVVGLAPPLTIDTQIADRMVDVLADAIEAIETMERDLLARERARPHRPARHVTGPNEFFAAMAGPVDRAGAAGVELAVQFVLDGPGPGTWLSPCTTARSTSQPSTSRPTAWRRPSGVGASLRASRQRGALRRRRLRRPNLTVDGDLGAAAQLMSLGLM